MATRTVRQSGGDYSTLAAALAAANAGDVISIEGAWTVNDTTAATINDDNITIQTDADSRHNGYYNVSDEHYRLVVSGANALTVAGSYSATIDGLAIIQAGTGTSDEAIRCVPLPGDTVTIKNCLIACAFNALQQDGIYTGFNVSIGTVTVENCVIYACGRGGIHSQNGASATHSGTINVNSCTLWLNGRYGSSPNAGSVGGGIRSFVDSGGNASGFTINVHNTISVENDTGGTSTFSPTDYADHVQFGTGPVWNISYSMDSDNSISGAANSGTGNLASRTATTNTSPGTGDWVIFGDISSAIDLRIIDNAENDAQDAHSTATAHGLTIPATDIVGTSRPQNTDYDIGGFEIGATGGGIEGSASITLAGATLAATGALTLAGMASPTLAAATLAASATLAIEGATAATLAAATLSATGALALDGTANVTLADATLSSTGALAITGVASGTLEDATVAAEGTSANTGTVAATLEAATLGATGTLTLIGNADVTLADAEVSAAGALALTGVVTSTLADATLTAAGVLAVEGSGVLTVTLEDATVEATGVLALAAAANVTLDAATVVSAGALALNGAVAVTLDDATLESSATFGDVITGAADVTLEDATVAATGAVALQGGVALTLADATVSSVGRLSIAAQAAMALSPATLASISTVVIVGAATIQLADATLVAAGSEVVPEVPTIAGFVYGPAMSGAVYGSTASGAVYGPLATAIIGDE